jgi:hypothetical protein
LIQEPLAWKNPYIEGLAHRQTRERWRDIWQVTDFTPSNIRMLIKSGQIDARISIDRYEIIFVIEDLVSDGIMSIEEGDEIMNEAREVITTEQLLFGIRKEELIEAYNRYVKRIEAKNISPERKEKLISPGRDIITIVYEPDNAKSV